MSKGAQMPSLRAGETFETGRLLSPEQGIADYLRVLTPAPPGVERVTLGAAFGRVLARDARADAPYPADRRSTMDGFAVRAADGTAPRRIVGAVRMGAAPPTALGAREAMRIPTGGVLPEGADAVIPIEDADDVDGTMTPHEAPESGAYFTPRGEDMAPGDLVLSTGRRIGAPELSVLATLGMVEVEAFRRPRIAIVSTGDELVEPSAIPETGQVRDSNRWAIAGGLMALGCEVVHLPRARDEAAEISARIAEGLAQAHAVVLTGGSSVGARDHVPSAINALGTPGVVVHGFKVKPGKPTVLAAIGTQPVIGLPGNPTSALAILDAIATPILRHLTGDTSERRATVATVASVPFRGRAGWTWYVPAVLESDGARPLPLRSSHTSLLARADGYVIVGPDRDTIAVGEPLTLVRYGVAA